MKYFTREELEDITREIVAAPTRETLKKLNEKYNGSLEKGENLVRNTQKINIEPPVVESIPNSLFGEKEAEVIPSVVEKPVAGPIPSLNIPSMEIPKTENIVNNEVNTSEMPSFELPKLETPTFDNQNNNPIPLTGNLWDTPSNNPNNLMQTTDNFGAVSSATSNTEVPVSSSPFFGPFQEPVNNPIPVSNTQMQQGPTMFGQFEQNYM